MSELPCDVVITFFDQDEKFIWETDCCNNKNNLVDECNKVYDTYGRNLRWEIGIVALCRGNGAEELERAIGELSINTGNKTVAMQ